MVDIIDGITVNISSYTYDRKSCKALLGNDEFKKVSIYLFSKVVVDILIIIIKRKLNLFRTVVCI